MTSITLDQVKSFASAWFEALDSHAPLEDCLAVLAEDGLSMHFPDGDLRDVAAFKIWYDRVTHLFFDEHHTIRSIEVVNETSDRIDVQLRVGWKSGWWEPPAANSKSIDLEVTQRWTLRRCSKGKNAFGLEIVEYHLSENFTYAPGSARLTPE